MLCYTDIRQPQQTVTDDRDKEKDGEGMDIERTPADDSWGMNGVQISALTVKGTVAG